MGKSELYKDDQMRIENEKNRKKEILHERIESIYKPNFKLKN